MAQPSGKGGAGTARQAEHESGPKEEAFTPADDQAFVQEAQFLGRSDEVNQRRVFFGNSMSLFADTLVVGAPQEDTTGGTDAGAAYVFVRSGTTWTEQVKLTASDAAAGDWFGADVSISGDTVVIGAPLADRAAGVNPSPSTSPSPSPEPRATSDSSLPA